MWIVGGGSGQGFKHGPAVGEVAARGILGEKAPDKLFSLANRAARAARGGFADTEKVRMV